jgi:DNA-binding Xre family transcriptional regulator
MAEKGMFATTELRPLLAARGVVLSREQVYRLVTGTPDRLKLATLAALCDIFAVTPTDLVEVTIASQRIGREAPAPPSSTLRNLRPRPARIVRKEPS